MLMGGDVHGNTEIQFLHRMECYILKIKNCEKVHKVFNDGVDWISPKTSGNKIYECRFQHL